MKMSQSDVDARVTTLERRLDVLEIKLDNLLDAINKLNDSLNDGRKDHEARIRALEKHKYMLTGVATVLPVVISIALKFV